MRRSDRASFLACALATSLAGCVPPRVGGAPLGPIAVDHLSDGAMRVREPDWFSVEMPGTPRSVAEADSTSRGRYIFKMLSLQTTGALFQVRYAEFLDERDVDEVKHVIPRRYLHGAGRGAAPATSRAIDVDGIEASEFAFRLDPDSEANATPSPVDVRVRIVWQGHRLYLLQCSTVDGAPPVCARFFDSFHLVAR